jgi:uncharacterized protein (TIGR02996 family)
MSLHEAFLQAIREEPEDDAPRLIYADWLDEHGESDRAAFIRAQCRLATLEDSAPEAAALREQARAILREHWDEWIAPLRPFLGPNPSRRGEQLLCGPFHPNCLARFERGFLEYLSLDAVQFVRAAPILARHVPLTDLALWGAGSDRGALAQTSYLHGIHRLAFVDYFDAPLTLSGLRNLAASPHLGLLRDLSLYQNGIGDFGAATLATAPWASNLQRLNVAYCDISPEGMAALAQAPLLRLEELFASRNPIRSPGLVALTKSEFFAHLQLLNLHDCGVGTRGMAAIAHTFGQGTLETLDLSSNPLAPDGARHLADAPILSTVTSLNLQSCSLHDAGVEALAQSPYLIALERLALDDNNLTDRALAAIASSTNLPRLELLSMHGNAISPEAAAARIPSPNLPRLRSLYLVGSAPRID